MIVKDDKDRKFSIKATPTDFSQTNIGDYSQYYLSEQYIQKDEILEKALGSIISYTVLIPSIMIIWPLILLLVLLI